MSLAKEQISNSSARVSARVRREHAGEWVALRSGRLVGSAKNLSELRKHPKVRRDDVTYRVPKSRLTA